MRRFMGYTSNNPMVALEGDDSSSRQPSSSGGAGDSSSGRSMGIAMTADLNQSQKPYPHTYRIYCMHFLFGLLYNIYNVGAVFYIAVITSNSLFVISLAGLISSSIILIFSPLAVRIGDKMNRLRFVQLSLLIKTTVITIGYALCIALVSTSSSGDGNMAGGLVSSNLAYRTSADVTSARDVNYSVYIYILPIFIAVAQLIYNTLAICIEKDWMAMLAGRDRRWLMSISRWLSIIDISSQTISPFLASLLFTFSSLRVITYLLIFTNIAVNLALFWFLRSIYITWPVLSLRRDLTVYDIITGDDNNDDIRGTRDSSSALAYSSSAAVDTENCTKGSSGLSDKIAEYRAHLIKVYESLRYSGCVLIMMSSSLQSLCVLNYGSVMTVYLLSVGMSVTAIGSFRGLAALFGFIGAICFPILRAVFGLRATGLFSVAFYLLFLSLSAFSFFFHGSSNEIKILLLTTFSMVSRVGFSSFDLSAKQISQEAITEINTRNQIYSVWNSITAFFELSTYSLTMLFSKSTDFWLLCLISAVASFISVIFFVLDDTSYLSNIFTSSKNDNNSSNSNNVNKNDVSTDDNANSTSSSNQVEMVITSKLDSDLVEVLF